ncbi:MAG: mechanosensitive ion channel domain-containing protein [Desulfatiglans sp.]|jgi:small conductance mechanosensitive channel|nr:mechanosensitive ion channel [Thermodesulfobacteriota bacterium]MEE4351532.1 mechanosensitive ion channel domain-containing protein [Desulfatiglans sp.]
MQDEIQAVEAIIQLIIDFFVKYSFQVIGAILVLVAGLIASKLVASFIIRFFERKNFDITLSKFIANIVRFIVISFAVIVALGKFGITIAPFVAAVAAVAFGASFAIQGPLANYGAGLVIIFTRPFVVGNTITVAGVNGVVEEVSLGATILTDEDGVKITIPNRHIVGEILHNSREMKIVEETVGISYDSDPVQAIRITQEALNEIEAVSHEPPPQVGIQKFGDSAIEIGYRYWVPTKKYFHTLYKVNLAVYQHLEAGHIQIPFPQRDVHFIPDTKEALPSESSS